MKPARRQTFLIVLLAYVFAALPASATICGDGVVETPERCDDGNLVDGDGCSSDCRVECPSISGRWKDSAFFQANFNIGEDPVGSFNGNMVLPPAQALPIVGSRAGIAVFSPVAFELLLGGSTFYFTGALQSCDDLALDGTLFDLRLTKLSSSYCGDETIGVDEECDDGNFVSGDSCTAACTVPACGDGVLDAGEQCDDGNDQNGDGCSNACELNRCGNGVIESGEQCDDANTQNGDGCSQYCQMTECGNGIVEVGEQCDDENTIDLDGCSSDCLRECLDLTGTWDSTTALTLRIVESDGLDFAGALVVNPNTAISFTGARTSILLGASVSVELEGGSVLLFTQATCESLSPDSGPFRFDWRTETVCGNGSLESGEECDDENFISGDQCTLGCTVARCGDAVTGPGEECDDGNPTNGDACDTNCTIPRCGNAMVAPGEQCDDGNGLDIDACTTSCLFNTCGDGFRYEGVEQCDDGNPDLGDGCEPGCLETVCANGTAIIRPRLTITGLGLPLGNEKVAFNGQLVFPPGMPAVVSPRETGIQLLIEDVDGGNLPVWELTHRTQPIPPWTAGTCEVGGDRWLFSPYDDKQTYSNRSSALDPPTCTAGSANGLQRLRVGDRRTRTGQIGVTFTTRDSTVASAPGSLKATVVLGDSIDDGLAGACGATTVLTCQANRTGTKLSCR
jgi:cysteine-rich repeat protein